MSEIKVLYERPCAPAVSIILLDWAVRESFHSLNYLNAQDVDRSLYEIIWLEYYDHIPGDLEHKQAFSRDKGHPLLDQWIGLGAPPDVHTHKHYCYNVGIVLARGKICVICDSDAIYPRDFVRRILDCFNTDEKIVVHVDQVRNENRRYYPFCNPDPSELLTDSMSTNWDGRRTRGVLPGADRLHEANYGACMAARRDALIAIGGADEHIDYLGYICGPYEMTFRLANAGHREWWLTDLFTIHTWHPSAGGGGNIAGPNDGRGISLRALEAQENGRVFPLKEDPAVKLLRQDPCADRQKLISILNATDFSPWSRSQTNLGTLDPPELVRADVGGHNIVRYREMYYALPQSEGAFLPEMADQGDYQERLVHGSDLQDVLGRAQQPKMIQLIQRVIGSADDDQPAPHPQDPPQLVRENINAHNIIRYRGIYYALPQTWGHFVTKKADRGDYRRILVHGPNLEDVASRIPRYSMRSRGVYIARSLIVTILRVPLSLRRGLKALYARVSPSKVRAHNK